MDNPKMKPVEQIKVDESKFVFKLMESFSNMGFNAKRLSMACEIYRDMIKSKNTTKFLALAGAMVPAGLQNVIYDLIEEGFVDVLVTTGANLTHDIVEGIGQHHLQGSEEFIDANDAELFDKKVNRIFDVFMPDEVYIKLEEWLGSFKVDQNQSVKDLLWELGSHLPVDSRSIVRLCYDKKIPIFCPAFTDSGLGMQLSFAYPSCNFNHFEDLQDMINIAWDAESAGVFIIGGGVPKNFIFQAMQFTPTSASYVVQITTDVQVSAGGLSSASLEEAVSWGKVNKQGYATQVHLDATVAIPLILSYLKYLKKEGKL